MLRGELRRVIYGRKKSVRYENDRRPNQRQFLGRRNDAWSPRDEERKLEQVAKEGVPVVTDLKRLESDGALTFPSGDGWDATRKPRRQDFHPQKRCKNDRNEGAKRGARSTMEYDVHLRKTFHCVLISNGGKYACQELPHLSRAWPLLAAPTNSHHSANRMMKTWNGWLLRKVQVQGAREFDEWGAPMCAAGRPFFQRPASPAACRRIPGGRSGPGRRAPRAR